MRGTVGFIGLGNIGRPTAPRLAGRKGLEPWVYVVAPDPVAELDAAYAAARLR